MFRITSHMLNSVRWLKNNNSILLVTTQAKMFFIAYTLITLSTGYLISQKIEEKNLNQEISKLELEKEQDSKLELKKEDFSVDLSDQLVRLKKYENQVKKKVDTLNSALNELDRSEVVFEEDAPRKSKVKSKSKIYNSAMGGGNSPTSLIIRDWETKDKNKGSIEKEKLNNKVSILSNDLDSALARLNSTPIGAPVSGTISSEFGWRGSPFASKYQFHQGIDISTEKNTPINSTADGIVIYAGDYGDYGKCIIIIHNSGLETLYAHLSKVAVKSGDKVCHGQQIGYVGTTGHSTGPHLHYEVRQNGSALNPQKYVDSAEFIKNILREKSDV